MTSEREKAVEEVASYFNPEGAQDDLARQAAEHLLAALEALRWQHVPAGHVVVSQAEIERLTAQLAKAREVVEPFAKHAELRTSEERDTDVAICPVEIGHLRAAARVHAELAEKEKENVLS